jgi:hypothetical protein
VHLYEEPQTQVMAVLIIHAVFLCLLAVLRPYNGDFYNFISIFNEFLLVILHLSVYLYLGIENK